MRTPKYLMLMKVKFDIPEQYFSGSYKSTTPSGYVWQVRTGLDSFIFTVSVYDGYHKVLTDEGWNFVRDKFVESRM